MAKNKPGRPPKDPSKKFLAAIDVLLAHEDYDTDQEGFWRLMDVVTAADPSVDLGEEWTDLHTAWLDFRKEVDIYDNRWNPEDMPHNGLWNAIGSMGPPPSGLVGARFYHSKPYKSAMPPEGMKAYAATPDMSHGQVALAFGLIDERGVPQLDLVQQELTDPGSVLDDNYQHPTDVEAAQSRQEAHAAYVERVEGIQAAVEAKVAEDTAECPETPQQLYEQGVGAEQYAVMLKLTPEQVEKQWAKFEAAGIERKVTPVTGYEVDDKGEPVPLSSYVPTIAETDPLVEGIENPQSDAEIDRDVLDVYSQMGVDELRGLVVSGIEDGAKLLTPDTSKEDMILILAGADEAALAQVD